MHGESKHIEYPRRRPDPAAPHPGRQAGVALGLPLLAVHVASQAPTAEHGTGSGRIAVELAAAQDGKIEDWQLIFPAGEVQRADSKQTVRLVDAPLVAQVSMARQIKPVVDFNHQTDFALWNGGEARAAGWIEEMQERAGAIWARITWTDDGRASLASRAYRYISPTYLADGSGNVTTILRAGLCNDPALVFRPLVASGHPSTTGDNVDKDLLKVASALALGATVSADAIVAAATNGQAAITGLVDIRKALGLDEKADVTAIVARIGEVQTAASGADKTITDLVTRMNAIEAGQLKTAATDKVEKAIASGKLPPAQRDWAIGYASRDPSGFDTFVAAQPQIVNGRQLPATPPGADAPPALDEVGSMVASSLGLEPKQLAAAYGGGA